MFENYWWIIPIIIYLVGFFVELSCMKTEHHVEWSWDSNSFDSWESHHDINMKDLTKAILWPFRFLVNAFFSLLWILYEIFGPILFAPFKKSYRDIKFYKFLEKKL